MRRVAVAVLILLVVLGAGVVFRVHIREAWEAFRRPAVPAAVDTVNTNAAIPASNTNQSPVYDAPAALPATLNIKAPFTTQAPHVNWDAEHEEFCEEAAVLMVGRHFSQRDIRGADDAELALQALQARELSLFGYFEDTTAAETAQLLEDRYPVQTTLLTNPTIDQLKRELAAGHLIIVPSAGRQLGNPNFKSPGPLYHMLVLKGYTADTFITNDAGTRKGADYVYPFERVMAAMHDWNGGDVEDGAKVVIVIHSA